MSSDVLLHVHSIRKIGAGGGSSLYLKPEPGEGEGNRVVEGDGMGWRLGEQTRTMPECLNSFLMWHSHTSHLLLPPILPPTPIHTHLNVLCHYQHTNELCNFYTLKGKTELLEQTGDGTDLVAQLEQLKEKLSEIEVSSGVAVSEAYSLV